MPAQSAVELLRKGKIKVIDTRSASERSAGAIDDSIPIQFGPDRWTESIAEEDRALFLAQLIEAGVNQQDVIVTVCNFGVRALAAAKFLRSVGFTSARSVAGGYIGKDSDPGWQFAQ